MRARIPLGRPYPKADVSQMTEEMSEYLWDGFFDELQSVRKRPGLTFLSDVGINYPVVGTYESVAGTVYASCNGKLYSIASNGTATEITPADGAKLITAGHQVRFAEDSFHVLFCDGTRAFYIASGSYYRIDSIISGATHIQWAKGYLLTNGLLSGGVSGDVTYCLMEVDGSYTPAKFAQYNNESLPDGVNAIFWKDNVLYALGPDSIEMSWATGDSDNPFAAIDAGTLSKGCENGDAAAIVGDYIMFPCSYGGNLKIYALGPDKSLKEVQQGIQRLLDTAVDVTTDLYAWEIPLSGNPGYILRVKDSGGYHTMVFDLNNNLWYEYTYDADYHWLMNCGVYVKGWGKFLVGDRLNTGWIYTHEGLTDDGETIVFEAHSGMITRGTYERKYCKRIEIQCRRGQTASTTVAAGMGLYWRNNLAGSWSGPRTISLGVKDDLKRVAQRQVGLGSYIDRMWSVVHNDTASDCIIAGMEEVYELAK